MGDDIPTFDELPTDAQDQIKRLLLRGAIEISDEVREKLRAMGLTEEEIVAMVVKSAGLEQ